MGREGQGCGVGTGAGRQGADAARRVGRSTDEIHQSGQDESAVVVMFVRRVATVDASRGPDGASLPGLTRQSILFARRWMPGTSPGMTGGGCRNMQRLALLAAMTALIAAPAAAQQSLTKVRVAYDGFSMTSGPLIYADKQGIFKKFGLDIAPIFIDGGSMLTQAVVGGSVDIAQNGYTPALSAAVQGADVVIIGGISNKLPVQLVVKTSITRPDHLKGQNVAISRYGSSPH